MRKVWNSRNGLQRNAGPMGERLEGGLGVRHGNLDERPSLMDIGITVRTIEC
jgi:hypothetical protein